GSANDWEWPVESGNCFPCFLAGKWVLWDGSPIMALLLLNYKIAGYQRRGLPLSSRYSMIPSMNRGSVWLERAANQRTRSTGIRRPVRAVFGRGVPKIRSYMAGALARSNGGSR